MPDDANVPHRSTVVDMCSGEPFVPEKASTKQDYTPVSKHRLGKLCIYIYSYIYILYYMILYVHVYVGRLNMLVGGVPYKVARSREYKGNGMSGLV